MGVAALETNGVAATLEEATGVSSHRFRRLEDDEEEGSSSHADLTLEATESVSDTMAVSVSMGVVVELELPSPP